jgi:hypothetical protein
VNEKLNRDSQPQSEPRGGGGGEAFPKKKFKTGNKKTAAHTAVKDHQKKLGPEIISPPLTLQVIGTAAGAGVALKLCASLSISM